MEADSGRRAHGRNAQARPADARCPGRCRRPFSRQRYQHCPAGQGRQRPSAPWAIGLAGTPVLLGPKCPATDCKPEHRCGNQEELGLGVQGQRLISRGKDRLDATWCNARQSAKDAGAIVHGPFSWFREGVLLAVGKWAQYAGITPLETPLLPASRRWSSARPTCRISWIGHRSSLRRQQVVVGGLGP